MTDTQSTGEDRKIGTTDEDRKVMASAGPAAGSSSLGSTGATGSGAWSRGCWRRKSSARSSKQRTSSSGRPTAALSRVKPMHAVSPCDNSPMLTAAPPVSSLWASSPALSPT